MRFNLCLNCLGDNARDVSVGPEKGHQMDSYRDTVSLCETCRTALLSGDFGTLAERFTEKRTVQVTRNESTRT